MLRQTVFLVQYEEENEKRLRGWISITMPPLRTIGGTPSMRLESKFKEVNVANSIWAHCCYLMNLAKNRGDVLSVEAGFERGPFFLEKANGKDYWMNLYEIAEKNMQINPSKNKILIQVAAQHPLDEGRPGPEFAARLDYAKRLFDSFKAEGKEVFIYVPGSEHLYNGVPDGISLSDSGKRYLTEKGIDPAFIYGDDKNREYMHEYGVYNSSDECYVAVNIFRDGRFGRLACVCSPNQIPRNTLTYIHMGILPECYSVPCENMFHNMVTELFGAVDEVLYRQHEWQDPNCKQFIEARAERKP